MAYRRGFKTEANSIAREVRIELSLATLDPLDPRALARHLDMPIIELSDLARLAGGPQYLLVAEPEAFSAVTVFRGSERSIVHNDAHADGRINSNITHELAHGLLLHPPTPALDDRGCRLWDADIEDEAQFLAGALLVTEDAALAIVRNRRTIEQAAQHFRVSPKMIEYRLNITGARIRVARTRRYQAH